MPEQTPPLLAQTKQLLRQFGLHARKGLGQHFLVDAAALEASISAAELSPDDIVVEVGPGLGVLTQRLAKSAGRVIAIELDSDIVSLLTERFSHSPNVTIVHADVLHADVPALLGQGVSGNPNYKVVANLPYYIAAPTIRRFLETPVKPGRMVVMVQKEVAENICAEPGKLSILGISVQLYGKPSIVKRVPAGSFYPVPRVDSAIVRIDIYPKSAVDLDPDQFFRVVKAGFSAPRKQLRNSLAKGLGISPGDAAEVLNRAGIDQKRRAETLALEEWAGLCRIVYGEMA